MSRVRGVTAASDRVLVRRGDDDARAARVERAEQAEVLLVGRDDLVVRAEPEPGDDDLAAARRRVGERDVLGATSEHARRSPRAPARAARAAPRCTASRCGPPSRSRSSHARAASTAARGSGPFEPALRYAWRSSTGNCARASSNVTRRPPRPERDRRARRPSTRPPLDRPGGRAVEERRARARRSGRCCPRAAARSRRPPGATRFVSPATTTRSPASARTRSNCSRVAVDVEVHDRHAVELDRLGDAPQLRLPPTTCAPRSRAGRPVRIASASPVTAERRSPWWSVGDGPRAEPGAAAAARPRRPRASRSSARDARSAQTGSSCRQTTSGRRASRARSSAAGTRAAPGGTALPWKRFQVRTSMATA